MGVNLLGLHFLTSCMGLISKQLQLQQKPKSNAILWKMHQLWQYCSKASCLISPNYYDALFMDDFATTMHAFCCKLLIKFHTAPGGLEFSQNMFFNVSPFADCDQILSQKVQLGNYILLQVNKNISTMATLLKVSSNLLPLNTLKFQTTDVQQTFPYQEPTPLSSYLCLYGSFDQLWKERVLLPVVSHLKI